MPRSLIARLARAACVLGVLLHLYTVVCQSEGGPSWFLFALLGWSVLPYGVAAWSSSQRRGAVPALGAAIACLIADACVHYTVFIAPTGSTAAVGLVVMPFWNLLLIGPAGAACLWLVHRLCGRRP